jgi:hypothetical protein
MDLFRSRSNHIAEWTCYFARETVETDEMPKKYGLCSDEEINHNYLLESNYRH